MGITSIVFADHVVSLLLREAEESLRQGTERGVVLIAQKKGTVLNVVRAISHAELERQGLIRVKIHDDPGWDTHKVSTYFDNQGILEHYANEIMLGNMLLFAHSHHPDFLEPSVVDQAASLSDGGAVCFSIRNGKLVVFGMYGSKQFTVTWQK